MLKFLGHQKEHDKHQNKKSDDGKETAQSAQRKRKNSKDNSNNNIAVTAKTNETNSDNNNYNNNNNDEDWIAESIVQFSLSPLWTAPVQDFIDDHCEIFDSEEEMKFEYTTVHRKFQALIDQLLTDFVNELGIPLERAVDAVKSSADHQTGKLKQRMTRLLHYLFSVDSFECFHRMMVRRNVELEVMACEALRAKGVMLDYTNTYNNNNTTTNANSPVSADAERLANATNGNVDENEALRLAIEASLQDQSKAAEERKLEAAQLAEAIAMNIQAEKEHAARLCAEVEQEVEKAAVQDVHAAQQLRIEKMTAIQEQKEHNIQQLTEQAICAKANTCEPRVLPASTLASSTPTASCTNAASQAQVQVGAQQVETKKNDNIFCTSATDHEKAHFPLSQPSTSNSTKTTKPGTLLTPTTTRPIIGKSALPPITSSESTFDTKSSLPSTQGATSASLNPTTTNTFENNVEEQTKSHAAMEAKASAQPSKEELQKRARYMREQREKIIAMNKANRKEELDKYALENNMPLANTESDAKAAEKQLTVEIARRLREDILEEARRHPTEEESLQNAPQKLYLTNK